MELFRKSSVCVAMAVLLGLGLAISPARASTPESAPASLEASDAAQTESTAAASGTLIYNEQTRMCLRADGTHVYTGTCWGREAVWHMVEPIPGIGRFFIINDAFGLCLDSNWAGHVYELGCNGGFFQMWYWIWGTQEFRNAETGYCLDSNYAGQAYTLGCNRGNFQRWGLATPP